jgi:hypothetical protein
VNFNHRPSQTGRIFYREGEEVLRRKGRESAPGAPALSYILKFCLPFSTLRARSLVSREVDMLVIPGVFKDDTFIPEKPFKLPNGTRGQFTVEEQSVDEAKLAQSQRAAVEAFVTAIKEIDEELPPEFDEIANMGLEFGEVDSL